MKTIEISDGDYEKPRHSFEFCEWINQKLKEMRNTGNFDSIYFERKGKNIKKFIEEAMPLSRLALHLSQPECEVYVTLYSGNQNYDAAISIEGFTTRAFKVEITTTENDETTMRRHVLSQEGLVPLFGSIRRNKEGIVYDYEMVDAEELENRIVSRMIERLKAKVESGKYDKNTVILIHLSEFLPLSLRVRAKLIRQTQEYIDNNQERIKEVYYTYTFSNSVDSPKFYEG